MRWQSSVVLAVTLVTLNGCAARAPKGVTPTGEAVKASAVTAPPTVVETVAAAHVMLAPSAIKWRPFPPGGPGTTFAVLAGDPEKPGPFVLRIKSPAGTKIPPHWHPADEHVTVIRGTLALGMGEKLAAKAARVLPAGSYALLPREMRHFGLSKTDTVVQVHGIGPFQVFFVNPADDPRNPPIMP